MDGGSSGKSLLKQHPVVNMELHFIVKKYVKLGLQYSRGKPPFFLQIFIETRWYSGGFQVNNLLIFFSELEKTGCFLLCCFNDKLALFCCWKLAL